MSNLYYVSKTEFDRILALPAEDMLRLELFATACRLNCLYMIARAGSGHIGTSMSAMDIMVTLQLMVLCQADGDVRKTRDLFFSSKGHDAPARYAVLLACGQLEFDLIHQLRRLDGLPGHPDVQTPYSYTNTGSLGMGVSKARGLALARRHLGKPGNIYVLTGDGELQEGQLWESLQPTANRHLSEITVIVDHNKMQSDTWVSAVSDLGNLEHKFAAFGWDVCRIDGHNYSQLCTTLSPRVGAARPRLVIADTVKGKGISFMEHSAIVPPADRLYPYHSGAPSAADYVRAVAELREKADHFLAARAMVPLQLGTVARVVPKMPGTQQRLVSAYAAALVEMGEQDPNLVVLDADLAKDTGVTSFQERFPDRFYECGIAEQDMVSQAGGMALAGLLPVVHSFACFLSDRPNEQIFNNATENTKIIYSGSLAGLLPAGPGHSHQCVRDIGCLAGVTNLTLIEPCCEHETKLVVEFAARQNRESTYIRLVSIPCDIPYILPKDYKLQLGCGVTLRDGADLVAIGYGPVLLSSAYQAAELLAQRGIKIKLVNFPWLNRADRSWLADCVADFPLIVTLDNHLLQGGQGQFILSELAQSGAVAGKSCISIGLEDLPKCGGNDEVLRAHGLDANSLASRFQRALNAASPVAGAAAMPKRTG